MMGSRLTPLGSQMQEFSQSIDAWAAGSVSMGLACIGNDAVHNHGVSHCGGDGTKAHDGEGIGGARQVGCTANSGSEPHHTAHCCRHSQRAAPIYACSSILPLELMRLIVWCELLGLRQRPKSFAIAISESVQFECQKRSLAALVLSYHAKGHSLHQYI